MIRKLVLGIVLLFSTLGYSLRAQGPVPVFFTIENVVQTPTTYSFDVYAEVTNVFMLNTYQLYIAYNTDAFGSSVVANDRFSDTTIVPGNNPHLILYEQLTPLPVPKYKVINIVDNTSDIMAITVDTRLVVPTPACPADSNLVMYFKPPNDLKKPLANLTFTFVDNTKPPGISLYLTLMIDQFIGGNDSCQLIQGDPALLPATFAGINAEWQSTHNAQITWDVVAEPDVVMYEVQKNIEGDQFETIGYVPANDLPRYSFNDEQASEKRINYRIKAINPNGDFIFSETVELVQDEGFTIDIYPNPAHDILNIAGLDIADNWEFHIFDLQGKNLRGGKLVSSSIDIADLPAGMYLIKLQNKAFNARQVLKFQKR
jgi:hypothetical protein